MAINITNEKYNGVAGLKANVGDWVDGQIDFAVTVEHEFNDTNKMYYRDATGSGGGVYQLEWTAGNWESEGFGGGDEIEIEVRTVVHRIDSVTGGLTFLGTPQVKYKQTISYLDSDPTKCVLNGPLELVNPIIDASYPIIPFSNPSDAIEFPDSYYDNVGFYPDGDALQYQYNIGSVRKLSRPEEIEFYFNLNQNGSTGQASVINGQVNRFLHVLPTAANFSAQVMTQVSNPSGGYFKNITIQQTEDAGATTKWSVKFKFMQWGLVESGYSEPDYYDAADCLAPIGLIKVFSLAGNPNGVLEANTSSITGNTGGYDESYNGGVSAFTKTSLQWYDSLGNPINGLDYSGVCTFEGVVEVGATQSPNHRYKIGLAYRPEDSDPYSTTSLNVGENLLVNAPENLFVPDGVVDSSTYLGEANVDGAKWDFSNIKISLVGTTVVVSGTVTANSAADTYFSSIADGGRTTTLWLSLGTVAETSSGTPEMPILGRVSLKLSNTDNIDAPIIGVQIPNVISETLLDHDGNSITDNSVDNTTTEDDILYVSEFLLPENTAFSGMKARISAYNNSTQEEFVLEETDVSFAATVTSGGIIQANEVFPRGFNLPPTTDRNVISIIRKASLDTPGFAGYELNYGFLNDWRYWLEQTNVNSDFYDSSEPFNGFNKNWQNFYSGDWLLRLSYFTELAGVEDYNHYSFKIRPYEDDVDVTASTLLTVLSNGTNPTSLVPNELIEIQQTFTWNDNFTDEWVEFTVEDYESGNRWVISSVLDQGSISANPLKPTTGNTKIEVSGTGTNVLVCKANIDTSLISVNKVSLTYRVYSSPNESGDLDLLTKKTTDGIAKKTTDDVTKLIAT
jgi:hypothetical protein